jgi:hypothetical protein
MITFSHLGRLGRLGNQLFQYAALKSVALNRGLRVKIPNPHNLKWHGQECPLHYFSLECEYLTDEDMREIKYQFREPDHTKFFPEIFTIPSKTDLFGYFQNYQYFALHEDQIRKEFTLKEQVCEEARCYIQELRNMDNADAEIVSVHMRRGDNTDGENPENINFYGNGDILTRGSEYGNYLYRAVDHFSNQDVKFLVFSGGSRKIGNQLDIEWCKSNFGGDNVYYCEGNEDIVDFEIMRQCDHNITCHMTSFGWWAAFLNDNSNKIVIAPKNYTVPDDGRGQRGFYPPDWRVI